MKKIYLLFISLLAGASMKAQFTLTASDEPVVGDQEITWKLDTAGISPGGAGTNQIWNFTGIVITPSVPATVKNYTTTAAAPNNSLYPYANMAESSDGQNYQMSAYTSSNIIIYGSTSSTLSIVYQNPLTIVTLPFPYGTISNDTYQTSYTYSTTPISENGTITTTADAYGTLNTPGNSFPNVLRIRIHEHIIQNIGAVVTNTIDADGYVFFGSATKYALLSVNMNSVTSSTQPTLTTKSKDASVSTVILQGIKENSRSANFSIYPNPASGKEIMLHYVLAENENYTATIYNSLGQVVKEVNLGEREPGMYHDMFDLSKISSGIYYLRLKGQKQDGMQKLVIE
jgi:hypothetical protein